MTKYITRPGVVLTEICGSYMIISAKANLTLCPYLTEVNNTSAFLWNRLRRSFFPPSAKSSKSPTPKPRALRSGRSSIKCLK